jgi:hypothetical protein
MRLVVFVAFAVSTACGGGGGGGGGGTAPPLTATFTASNPTPGAGDVALQGASASNATFTVDVTFTDIADVFGATLTLTYDANVIRFDTSSTATTFFTPGPVSNDRFLEVDGSTAGVVRIAASRFAGDPGVDVVGTRSLARLTFTARRETAGSALNFAGNLEVCDSQIDPDAACGANGAIVVQSYSGGTVIAN